MGLRLTRIWPVAVIAITALTATVPAQALQCVPYARAASGIDLRGDAWRWWNAAAGVYDRGHSPKVGAVMVFRKTGKMRLGHVAVVRLIVNAREVLIDHANWGPRNAGRGSVTKMVAVRDISPHNDWSAVQVWNVATSDFGLRAYPTYGFIYPRRDSMPVRAAVAVELPAEVTSLLADYGPANLAAADTASPAANGFLDVSFVAPPTDEPQDQIAPASQQPVRTAASTWDGDRAAAARAGSGRY